MDSSAAGCWTNELHRRQAVHVEAVHRCLSMRAGEIVSLAYGPRLAATGTLLFVEEGFVCLELRAGWHQWVPLLQVTGVDGEAIQTARLLEGQSPAGEVSRALYREAAS